jgi:succinoglycan biosynthesis transport protein ExoP
VCRCRNGCNRNNRRVQSTGWFQHLRPLRPSPTRSVCSFGSGIFCAIAAAAAAWSLLPPPSYKARALLHISSIPPRVIFQTNESWIDYPTYQRNQLTYIKSRLVLTAALRSPEVARLRLDHQVADPLPWLEEKIQVRFDGEILHISMDGADPDEVAILVNAVTDAYLKEVVYIETDDRRRRFERLKQVYGDFQSRLTERRDELRRLAEELGSDDRAMNRLTHEMFMQRRSDRERERDAIQSEILKSEAELTVRQARKVAAAGEIVIPDSIVDHYVRQDELVQQYQSEIESLQASYEAAKRLTVKPSDPSRRNSYGSLVETRAALETRIQQLRPWWAEQLRKRALETYESDITMLQDRIAVLREQEKQLVSIVEGLSVETETIGRRTMDLGSLQDEIEHADTAAKKVGDEVAALDVELDAPPRVRLFEDATVPRLEDDKRPKLAGMAGLGTLALVLLGVSWNEFRARKIESVDEVIQSLGLPIIGTLPLLNGPKSWRRVGRKDSTNREGPGLLVESIDAARTYLLHASRLEGIQVVMVTSASGGEGKTSLSCHLATSLARAGRRTLLIDGDLRRPAVHRLFDIPPEPGLSELVRGEAELDTTIQPTASTDLWILTAGRGDSLAVQALAREPVQAIFDQLRRHYDFIIVDTPPVLAVADALLIGQHVDAALCSILRDVSRVPLVYVTNQRLQTLGIRVLGAIMAGVSGDLYGTTYHYAETASANEKSV